MAVYKALLVGVMSMSAVAISSDYQLDRQYEYEDDPVDYPSPSVEDGLAAELPKFISEGGQISVGTGGKASMPCKVNDLGHRQMIWSKVRGGASNEDQLFVGTTKLLDHPHLQLIEIPMRGGSLLSLTNAVKDDEGTYICRIADPKDTRSLKFQLTVHSGPSPPIAAGHQPQGDDPQSSAPVSSLTGSAGQKQMSSLLGLSAAILCVIIKFL